MSSQSSSNTFFDRKSPGGGSFSLTPGAKVLDSIQLAQMERSFRAWVYDSPRRDVRCSRQRILIIFLLIRHTGAKLHEVLNIRPAHIDLKERTVSFGDDIHGSYRVVGLPDELIRELEGFLKSGSFRSDEPLFRVDPAHVRRKFYERAASCGLPKDFGSPSTLRRSRSVELLQGNLPLPVVQKLLGHSSPVLTTSLLKFSDDDIQHLSRLYLDLESKRRTSARNSFFGKITRIEKGDIQSQIVLLTLGGIYISSVITNNSLERMRLRTGTLVRAEIKAPWIIVAGPDGAGLVSAENQVQGTVMEIITGRVNTEIILSLADGTEICAVITTASFRRLRLSKGDQALALFGAYSVILNIE